MPLLSDLLGNASLRLRHLVDTGRDPDIGWVATSELGDPTPHLEGGELLLFTGIATVGWDAAQWESFVARLAARGVHAIGLGTGLSHGTVPEALVDAARDHGIDLVEVPREIPFIAVGRAVADLIAESERAALMASAALQRELMTAIVGRGGPHRVLELLAGELRSTAIVADARGDALDLAGPVPSAATTGRVRESVAAIRARGIRGSAAHLGPAGSVIVQPLGLTDPPSRYLAVAADRSWGPTERTAITIAAALLSLDAERTARQEAGVRELRDHAIALLVDGQTDAAQSLLEVSGTETLPSRIRMVRVASDDPSSTIAALFASGLTAAGILDDTVVAAIPALRAKELADLLPVARVGVGTRVTLAEAPASDAAAMAALGLSSEQERVVLFESMAAHGVLGALDRTALAAFADAALAPLDGHADSEELVETLRVFLAHNGLRQPAATQLGLHRNTLRNRLSRIEGLLRRDLDDPAARVDLWVALRGRSAGRPEGTSTT